MFILTPINVLQKMSSFFKVFYIYIYTHNVMPFICHILEERYVMTLTLLLNKNLILFIKQKSIYFLFYCLVMIKFINLLQIKFIFAKSHKEFPLPPCLSHKGCPMVSVPCSHLNVFGKFHF